MSKTIIFTDGSSRGNPGPGGWGAIVSYAEGSEDRVRELGGRDTNTTNNRMELTAVIEAIDFAASKGLVKDVVLYTDSEYVKKGATEWIHGWKRNDWKTSAKGEVLNRDLWERLSELLPKVSIEFKVIKGHSGVSGNERCDVIATTFADGAPDVLFDNVVEKYKINLDVGNHASVSKDTKSKSSSKKAYSYVSMIDGVVKTHKTWAECEARVRGKSNARYKKSFSKENEDEIIKNLAQR